MKPRIAVFSGPTATILNAPPLVTSNKAREEHGLPLLKESDGSPLQYDALRPQRLAAPATVFVEQFSAHPLERDVQELSAPPDGYVSTDGTLHEKRSSPEDIPAYRLELRPEDGLYPLPYMGRQADGMPWDPPTVQVQGEGSDRRQTFLPDASRLYEEIDRLAVVGTGVAGGLSSLAEFDFYRPIPSGGYTTGLDAAQRTDVGDEDIPPESIGEDFFPYSPAPARIDPSKSWLAIAVNSVQTALATNRYVGAQWLDGTPTIDEALYWLGLLVDTNLPIVGHSAQRLAQTAGFDGAPNILDGVRYILSRCWAGEDGRDRVGPVLIVDGLAYAARDVAKVAARPGGYELTGGKGGVVGDLSDPPRVRYIPQRRFTSGSALRLTELPEEHRPSGPARVSIQVKQDGRLNPDALPSVELFTFTRYRSPGDAEAYIVGWLDRTLSRGELSGIVFEGITPSGLPSRPIEDVLAQAVLAGVPVVCCGRGHTGGRALSVNSLLIAGDNLTGPKARVLLLAALLKLGPIPAVHNQAKPSRNDIQRVLGAVRKYQDVFDSH